MHSLPSQFKSIRFSAHLDACLCYIDRDSRECHLLYSLLCTFWPCIRSPGNVLWEFKSLCLATAISLQSCAHMHSLRRQLWSSNARELNQKQFGWDNIERVIKDESHNIYGAPQALYHRWKFVFNMKRNIWNIIWQTSSPATRASLWLRILSLQLFRCLQFTCDQCLLWNGSNVNAVEQRTEYFQWRNIVNWDFQDVERLGDMDIDLLSGVNIKMLKGIVHNFFSIVQISYFG